MLKIEEIKNVSFRRSNLGGYKPQDVDAFIDDVIISFEKLSDENQRLQKQVEQLNGKIRKFYEEDDSIKQVILGAQRIAEQSISDAQVRTSNMLSEATEKSQKMVEDAKKEVLVQSEISDRLKLESANLKKQLEDIYKKHMKIIDEIPGDISQLEDTNSRFSSRDKFDCQESAQVLSMASGGVMENVNVGSSDINHTTGDVFASGKFVECSKKFEDLKFGKNISDSDNSKSHFGMFKKK